MIVIDRAKLDHTFAGSVVGDQITAMRREMGMIFEVDMHLLTRIGREQGKQQESCNETSYPEVHLH